ncbi:Fc fragment of IgE, low affinity II, receptor for (CD23) [Chamberlinius hualienensis]
MRIGFLLACATLWLVASGCPDTFTELPTGCYYFSDTGKTWFQALRDCIKRGAYMISLESAEENDAIRSQLNVISEQRNHLNDWWLGAWDGPQEGAFQWVSYWSRVNYSDWSPGDPNNLNVENCVHVTPSIDYHWEDYSCNCPYDNYICEL